eukprot:8330280-Lingulodinium_polyedra.AAC.1
MHLVSNPQPRTNCAAIAATAIALFCHSQLCPPVSLSGYILPWAEEMLNNACNLHPAPMEKPA